MAFVGNIEFSHASQNQWDKYQILKNDSDRYSIEKYLQDSISSGKRLINYETEVKNQFDLTRLNIDAKNCLAVEKYSGECLITAEGFNNIVSPFQIDLAKSNNQDTASTVSTIRNEAMVKLLDEKFRNDPEFTHLLGSNPKDSVDKNNWVASMLKLKRKHPSSSVIG